MENIQYIFSDHSNNCTLHVTADHKVRLLQIYSCILVFLYSCKLTKFWVNSNYFNQFQTEFLKLIKSLNKFGANQFDNLYIQLISQATKCKIVIDNFRKQPKLFGNWFAVNESN